VLWTGSQASVLASSPEDFAQSNGIQTCTFDVRRRGFSMSNAGLSMSTEVFRYPSLGADDLPLYAIKLNCTFQQSRSRSDPVVLLLHSKDTELVVFERAGRIFRTWNDVRAINWKDLGRRDIVISQKTSREVPGQTLHQRLRLILKPGVMCEQTLLASVDAKQNLWIVAQARSSDTDLFSLTGSSIVMKTCRVPGGAGSDVSFFVLVRGAFPVPRIGIFPSKYPLEGFLRSVGSKAAAWGSTSYPVSDGRFVQIGIRPSPATEGSDSLLAKNFCLGIRLVERPPPWMLYRMSDSSYMGRGRQ
jgi:hypothetical protein